MNEGQEEGVRGYKGGREEAILLFFPNFQHMLHSYFWSTKGIRKDKIRRVVSGGRQSRLGMENRRRKCCPGSSEVHLEHEFIDVQFVFLSLCFFTPRICLLAE